MKTNSNKYILIILSVVAVFSFSCKKALDINEDPNNAPLDKATPYVLFPPATLSTVGRIGTDGAVIGGIWGQYWTQSNASNQYKTIDAYNIQRGDYNDLYTQLFSGALQDYSLMLKLCDSLHDNNFGLMGTVMKAYTYQVLVDLYDQVPYKEAFGGLNQLQPKFDDGYSIYEWLLADLNKALAKDLTVPILAENQPLDMVYRGDMTKWVKFANTLKLKMYLRMVNAKPAEATDSIKSLISSGAAFLTDVDASVSNFKNAPGQDNPLYESNIRDLNTTTNIRASNTMLLWLQKNKDTRIPKIFRAGSGSGGVYYGINQGDYTSISQTYNVAATYRQSPLDTVYIISRAETYFMLAEVNERYYAGANAKAMYDNGVLAAFQQLKLNGSAFIAAGGAYEYPSGGTFDKKLEAIITQKWASFPGCHALEGYLEQNRTGYPKFSPVYSTDPAYVPGQWVYSRNGVTGAGKFPKRMVFPDVERSRNKNTPAEVPIYQKVWWSL
ncbi:SusD-like starch-binding protein associating with outer membrane [Chitinophaga niastensis]|uniref:SusD-like starch-binding protein associating with outer membrane n=1 Tax=Chitinophaga niastensis TaxID=536980 RepID=A0A2P8HMQ7_CHINA|nr:SusD/RagB family nutrient-binding outer membrane lipoprotein [Chitinophaga niastensis]PSL47477.1 SusD-like starch-binding protein associating with outer membrane [Chitinophaga niastensis]